MAKPKILVIGMLDSIHLARWLSQIVDIEAEIVVTGTSPYRSVRPEMTNLVRSNVRIQELFPGLRLFDRNLIPSIIFLLDQLLGNRVRGWALARLIRREKPDLIHVNELQVAGYPALVALRRCKEYEGKLWVTNYGSELVWYSAKQQHRDKLTDLLSRADAFSAECQRDVDLAMQLGFLGSVLEVFPVSGGLTPCEGGDDIRSVIAVKGYDNQWGMGRVAVERVVRSLERLGKSQYEVVVFSSNFSTIRYCRKLQKLSDVAISVYGKGELSHSEMLDLFSKSLAYVGVSKSDGISTSMLEAMSQGAVPLQTSTSCASEWFIDGETGFSLSLDDLSSIDRGLGRLFDSEFEIAEARKRNMEIVASRANPEVLKKKAIAFYLSLLTDWTK